MVSPKECDSYMSLPQTPHRSPSKNTLRWNDLRVHQNTSTANLEIVGESLSHGDICHYLVAELQQPIKRQALRVLSKTRNSKRLAAETATDDEGTLLLP